MGQKCSQRNNKEYENALPLPSPDYCKISPILMRVSTKYIKKNDNDDTDVRRTLRKPKITEKNITD
jgi:hypothetical protein